MSNLKFVAKVVKVCSENRDKFLTIRQISQLSSMSYNATYRTVHSLVNEEVIKLTKIGSASVAQLTDSAKTKGFVALAESYSENGKKK